MEFKEVEIVDVMCLRCNRIHSARKEDCEELKKYPSHYTCRVLCTGDPCDGMNGEIWHMMHGPDRYVIGFVVPESYKHPSKRTIPVFE